MTVFEHDIYGRTRGHLVLSPLLGKFLREWVGVTNDIAIGGWVAHLCNSRFAGQQSSFPSIATIYARLSAQTIISRGARNIVPNLLHNVENEADPSLASPCLRVVIDCLETEGIVVCTEVGDLVEVWIPAPLHLVGLLSYFNFVVRVEFLNEFKSR